MNEAKPNKSISNEFSVTVAGDEKIGDPEEIAPEPFHPGHPEPEKETKPEPEKEPEKEPEIVDATNLDAILADTSKSKTDTFDYEGKRYTYEYIDIPWEKYEQILDKVARDSKIHPKLKERAEQKEIMLFRIQKLLKTNFDIHLLIQLGTEFGEAFRKHMFESNGLNRFDEQIMGELTENLKPEMQKLIEQEKTQKKRGM